MNQDIKTAFKELEKTINYMEVVEIETGDYIFEELQEAINILLRKLLRQQYTFTKRGHKTLKKNNLLGMLVKDIILHRSLEVVWDLESKEDVNKIEVPLLYIGINESIYGRS